MYYCQHAGYYNYMLMKVLVTISHNKNGFSLIFSTLPMTDSQQQKS